MNSKMTDRHRFSSCLRFFFILLFFLFCCCKGWDPPALIVGCQQKIHFSVVRILGFVYSNKGYDLKDIKDVLMSVCAVSPKSRLAAIFPKTDQKSEMILYSIQSSIF
jgi:hypothetical protein